MAYHRSSSAFTRIGSIIKSSSSLLILLSFPYLRLADEGGDLLFSFLS